MIDFTKPFEVFDDSGWVTAVYMGQSTILPDLALVEYKQGNLLTCKYFAADSMNIRNTPQTKVLGYLHYYDNGEISNLWTDYDNLTSIANAVGLKVKNEITIYTENDQLIVKVDP